MNLKYFLGMQYRSRTAKKKNQMWRAKIKMMFVLYKCKTSKLMKFRIGKKSE
jgi:hypothetical protein